MISNGQIELVDRLQSLLEKQIELARRGNIVEVEALSEQAGSVFVEVARTGLLELAEFKNRREQLRKLHKSLCLTITAQKADIAQKLSNIRKGKKTLKTYRDNTRFK